MGAKGHHGAGLIHRPPGVLWHIYRWLRGTEQILVRPASELPLVLISYAPGEMEGMKQFREALAETWTALPEEFREHYRGFLETAPSLVVVLLRGRNICTCLGHHHPKGTESPLTRRLRSMSGVQTGEIDLAVESIRRWEPQPLSHLALPAEAERASFRNLQWRLALITVFLHELHHMVRPDEAESVVRGHSQRFYDDALARLVEERFGLEYGLRFAALEEPGGTGRNKTVGGMQER